MLALVQQLLRLADQLAAYDNEIARLFQAHADQPIFNGLPGAGKRLAPRLLAEWGDDRSRYASAESRQALGDTSPVPIESGKHASVQQRPACLKPLPSALFQFARAVDVSGTLGRGLLPTQAQGGQDPQHGGASGSAMYGFGSSRPVFRKHKPNLAATFLATQQAHGCLAA
ncbi:MAG TPA: transposase [Ktedonobacterales bacterium]|jgi:hypothetical protein